MTIKDFFGLIAKDKEAEDKLTADIAELLKQEAALDNEMKAAADAGDVERYIAKNTEKGKVSAAIFVKRNVKDKLVSSVNADTAKEAWTNYAADYNKKMEKALAEFEAEKQKFLQMYSALIDLQTDALTVRRQLAKAVDLDEDRLSMSFIPYKSGAEAKGLLKLGGFSSGDPDAAYYLSNYCIRNNANVVRVDGTIPRDPEEERVSAVVIMRKPSLR